MRRTALALLALAALAACEGEQPIGTGVPETGLTVVNASAGAVDVLVDGSVVLRGLAGRTVSPLLPFAAGTHRVSMQGAQQAATDVTAARGARAIVAVAPVEGSLTARALSDTGAAPVAGKSKLRVVHLAASAPPIDVWRTQPDYMTPTRVMFPFRYGAESAYIQSTPGTWTVWVTPADSTAPTLGSSGGMAVGSGEVLTVVILDAADGKVTVQPVGTP